MSLGIVLAPLRVMAATVLTLCAYDAAVALAATTAPGRDDAARPELAGTFEYVYDATSHGHDGDTTRRTAGGAGAVPSYDGSLEATKRRQATEGVSYGATAATPAAEGSTALATQELNIGVHTDERMAQHEVTEDMVRVAVRDGRGTRRDHAYAGPQIESMRSSSRF